MTREIERGEREREGEKERETHREIIMKSDQWSESQQQILNNIVYFYVTVQSN